MEYARATLHISLQQLFSIEREINGFPRSQLISIERLGHNEQTEELKKCCKIVLFLLCYREQFKLNFRLFV